MNEYPNLFSPLQIGSLTLKNRIEASATSLQEFDSRGFMKDTGLAYYREKAAGGSAMVVVGETPVHVATGLSHPNMLRIEDPAITPVLADLADAIHQFGGVASLQLAHGGAFCTRQFLNGRNPIGPSAMDSNPFGDPVDEMDEDMIHMIVEAFGDAALRLKIAGFDMCQVHAGHGWLLGQFLSPLVNKRTDRFGGSHENRARIVEMVLDNIRAKCGKNFPIELRISGTEKFEGGYTLEDGIEFCKILNDKVDLFNISVGTVFNAAGRTDASPCIYNERGQNVPLAAAVKKHVTKPVATLGSLVTPEQMEEVIASGQADVICTARTVLADPYFAKKAKAGKADEIRPCLRCLACMDGMLAPKKKLNCVVNPVIGRERDYWKMPPITEKKKVLVIGGGPGGMQAAITAAERGHDVTLVEKNSELGGELLHARHVPFKDDMVRYLDWLVRLTYRRGVRVLLNTEADAELVRLSAVDAVIAAVGAEAVKPPIPGADHENVILATEMYGDGVEIGQNVVVIGAGSVGCEAAIHMAMLGKKVTLLEAQKDYLPEAAEILKIYTTTELNKYGIVPQCSMKVTKLTGYSVEAEDAHGMLCSFKADTVILATGLKPLAGLREELRTYAPEFYPIGDCVKPARIQEATAQGYAAAMWL